MHPDTIAPDTQSVTVSVNGGSGQTFNCGGTTCTLHVAAPIGIDTFTVSTYSGAGGAGAMLDRGTMTAPIVAGKANSFSINLGPVVSTTADGGPGSLRYAVASAHSGDTILFVVPSDSTIVVSAPIAVPNGVTISGPGFTASAKRRAKRAAVTYSGVTISGGGASQIFTVGSGVTATISGLILTQGIAKTANKPGGAVYNVGTLTLLADALVDNTSNAQSPLIDKRPRAKKAPLWKQPAIMHPHCAGYTYYEGGAVYNDGTLTVTNSTFDSNALTLNIFTGGCELSDGGALFNDVDAALNVTGSTFIANAAFQGGAVYNNAATHAATFSGDTFEGNMGCNTAALGCPLSGCSGSACTSSPVGYGAAIIDFSGPGVTIDSSTFSANVAGGTGGPASSSAGFGGALALATGQPLVTNSTFTNNIAGGGAAFCSQGEGGAIYAQVPLTLNGDTFTGNSAAGDAQGIGGAVFVDDYASVVGRNDSFTSNSASGTGGTACSKLAAAAGGAVAAETTNFAGSTFSRNSGTAGAQCMGGALFAQNSATLTSDAFDHDTCTATLGADTAFGGAIAVAGNVLTMQLTTVTSNAAIVRGSGTNSALGGGAYVSGALTSTRDTFSSNLVQDAGASGQAAGGAVWGSILATTNDTFAGNSAAATSNAYGGAADVALTDGTNSVFTSNSVTAGVAQGGALYENGGVNGGTSGGSFASNVAGTGTQTGAGGAIYDSGTMTIRGTSFTNNSATARGGAIYDGAGDTISGITATGNGVTAAGGSGVTPAGGGAIWAAAAQTVTNSTFSNNTVHVSSGSSVCGGGAIYDDGGLVVAGSTFLANSVTGSSLTNSGGGAIFTGYGTTLFNDTIVQNTVSQDGGGVETSNGVALIAVNVTLDANAAGANGGNLNNPSGGALYLGNSIVAGGTAPSGADIETAAGSFFTEGYNISTTTPDGGTLNGTGDQPNTNPQLLSLANNGGTTQTMADQANGPGTAYIPFSGSGSSSKCGATTSAYLAVDQRGYSRGQHGSSCDVGAYEFYGVAPALRTRGGATDFRPPLSTCETSRTSRASSAARRCSTAASPPTRP
jgi:predicted outer membrane repeat protein